jgi:L-ascorbate metabolism protein UlaG (beta-lactamase superfamily)
MIKLNLRLLFLLFVLMLMIPVCASVVDKDANKDNNPLISDHFDGKHYFNPNVPEPPEQPDPKKPQRSHSSWIWSLLFGKDWPEWPDLKDTLPGQPPVTRVEKGAIRITPVNHATFLIQMDGYNILTDPVWSKRVGPLSWLGVKRHRQPGIRFEDLPSIDAVLVSHNHYDHMDMPTLELLAKKFHPRALTALGNLDNLLDAGFKTASELDWWQSVKLSPDVTITLVPAQHFSLRSLWNRDETLWGGFVISGPSGNVFFAGDTGYGPHFKEIARRFAPIKIALLPIAPFHQPEPGEEASPGFARIHIGPSEAVQAHIDLGAQLSLACHFQTFQLGTEEFDAAPKALTEAAAKHGLKPGAYIAPVFGEMSEL